MITRDTAEIALRKCNYERYSIAPSISGYDQGISINVYFAAEVSKTYAYGHNGKVEGYIAPIKLINQPKAIQAMIGYHKPIVIIDSKGNEYVAD